MSDKFKGKMIFSDVDGTLIDSNTGKIPDKNIEAIKYFVENGGTFTLATGRGYRSAAQYIKELPINAPCIFLNGGQIYDIHKDEILEKTFLPKDCNALLQGITDKFSHTTALVVCEDGYYLGTEDRTGNRYSKYGKETIPRLDIMKTDKKVCKVLYIIGEEDHEEFVAFTKTLHIEGMKVVFSAEICAEFIPENCTKANAMMKVAGICSIDPSNIVAIGDYFNDYEMIQQAGLGASVENGHPEIKEIADIVLCNCNDGALFELISYIEEKAV